MTASIIQNWKSFFKIAGNRNRFILSVLSLASALFLLTKMLHYAENRNGVTLNDPVLNLFNPVNVTWLTFGVIYFSLIIALIYLVKNPANLLLAIQSYTLVVLFRMTGMYLAPFDPPAAMIPLADPFVEVFGTGKLMTKDLFFSGHTATLFILYLTAEKKLKPVFLTGTIIVASAVLLQHVHYTVDVLAAPFFTYCAHTLAVKINKD